MTDGETTEQQDVPEAGAAAQTQAAQAPPDGTKVPEDMSVGELVFEVSDRASVLIRVFRRIGTFTQ